MSPKREPDVSTPDTPSKRARLAAIEAGLQARRNDETPQSSSTLPDTLPFTQGIEENQVADTDEQGYSFLGLQDSQAPSTPQRRRTSTQPELFGLRAEPALLTPPQTARTSRVEPGSSRPEPVTPTRDKGKARADVPLDDDDDPFPEITSLSLQPTLAHARLEHADAPTTGERIAHSMIAFRDVADKVRAFADTMAQLDASTYIERLERRHRALETKNEAKKEHIEVLTAERDALRDTVGRLEERCRRQDEIIASLTGSG